MNTMFRRDQITAEDAAMQRTLALQDALGQLRRADSAVQAAASGEPEGMRAAVLGSVHDRLTSLLAQLQALE